MEIGKERMSMKVLILGGVAAGTKVAAKLKRMQFDSDVTILTKDADISYAGCGLPYYVGDVIQDRDKIIVNTPEKFAALTGANVLTGREAIGLDAKAKQITVKNLAEGTESVLSYDACVIATGASSIVPPMKGIDLEGVFTMRTPDNADQLKQYIKTHQVKKAVIAGGGFIGLEIAENLKEEGVDVTVIDMAPQIMPGFDTELAIYAQKHLEKVGIPILTATKMEEITGDICATGVKTDKGLLGADVVILSLGIRPNTAFLKDTGLEFAKNGAILVDHSMRTALPDVYAAGDCAVVSNFQTGEQAWAPMGSSANMEGRLLAEVLSGAEKEFHGVLRTAVVKMPGLNAARTGLNEIAAKEAGYDIETVVTVNDDKAHYYPGADNFITKLIADKKTHKLLGVQVLGPGAVDKMVDIGVTAITLGATLEQLENMDLAYAPPFSTAIHPFVAAVNIMLNKLEGRFDTMTPAEYLENKGEGYRIIDVSPQPALPNFMFVDVAKVNSPLEGIAKDEKILLICAKGKRSYLLQQRLKHFGYTNTKVLEGALWVNEAPTQGK